MGHVNADNLSITVKEDGHLSVRFDPLCQGASVCFFQPAVLNKTSNYTLYLIRNRLNLEDQGVSLFFAAFIETITGIYIYIMNTLCGFWTY